MQTRFLPAARTILALGGIIAMAGCDDITAGQVAQDPNAPMVARIMIQDDGPAGGRGVATNILDNAPNAACDDTNPCPAPVLCGSFNGSTTLDGYNMAIDPGKCYDPESVTTTPPPIGIPFYSQGMAIRVVLSKPIAPTIEMVSTTNGVTRFSLPDGIVTLTRSGSTCTADTDCENGEKCTSGTCQVKMSTTSPYYDPIGSPLVTSSTIINPYGPAIAMKPAAPLAPATKYTITLNTDMITDAKGQKLVLCAPGSLPKLENIENPGEGIVPKCSSTQPGNTYDFTTESLELMQEWNCPAFDCLNIGALVGVGSGVTTNFPDTSTLDVKCSTDDDCALYGSPTAVCIGGSCGEQIAPNDVFQLQFNADVDPTTGTVTLKSTDGKTTIPVEVFNDMSAQALNGVISGFPTCMTASDCTVQTMTAPMCTNGMCIDPSTGQPVIDAGSCGAQLNTRMLDVVPATNGMRMDIPAGDYVLTISGLQYGVQDAGEQLVIKTDLTFPVRVGGMDSDPTMDPYASVNIVLPESCITPPAMPDMAASGGDMSTAAGDMSMSSGDMSGLPLPDLLPKVDL